KSSKYLSWFSRYHLGLQKACHFKGYFLIFPSPRQIFLQNELNMNAHSVVDWTNFCRKIIIIPVGKDHNILGGHGKIIEIDEAKIDKRKYNRGHILHGQWVFGGYERDNGRVQQKKLLTKRLVIIIYDWSI
ncbi:hypothetical protein EAI_15308, partial [Harpegnathos saltator]